MQCFIYSVNCHVEDICSDRDDIVALIPAPGSYSNKILDLVDDRTIIQLSNMNIKSV